MADKKPEPKLPRQKGHVDGKPAPIDDYPDRPWSEAKDARYVVDEEPVDASRAAELTQEGGLTDG